MYFDVNKRSYLPDQVPFTLERFRNELTLNIFSDGSYDKNRKYGSFAVIAVMGGNIINQKTYYMNCKSANEAELEGLCYALGFALTYANQFTYINIFSDSQYGIKSFTDFLYKWRFDAHNHLYYKVSPSYPKEERNKLAANINKIYELNTLFIQCLQSTQSLNIYHVKSHGDPKSSKSVKTITDSFRYHNGIWDAIPIEYNFIRYIISYNNNVDSMAKSTLNTSGFPEGTMDAISFIPNRVMDPNVKPNNWKGRRKK